MWRGRVDDTRVEDRDRGRERYMDSNTHKYTQIHTIHTNTNTHNNTNIN